MPAANVEVLGPHEAASGLDPVFRGRACSRRRALLIASRPAGAREQVKPRLPGARAAGARGRIGPVTAPKPLACAPSCR